MTKSMHLKPSRPLGFLNLLLDTLTGARRDFDQREFSAELDSLLRELLREKDHARAAQRAERRKPK